MHQCWYLLVFQQKSKQEAGVPIIKAQVPEGLFLRVTTALLLVQHTEAIVTDKVLPAIGSRKPHSSKTLQKLV